MAQLISSNYPLDNLKYVVGLDSSNNVQLGGRTEVDVRDFGAVMDGIADDSTAIQAALDSGARYVCCPGTAKVGTMLTVSAGTKFEFYKLIPGSSAQTIIRVHGSTEIRGQIDTSAFTAFSGTCVLVDGQSYDVAGQGFLCHIRTVIDVYCKAGGGGVDTLGLTGTAVWFKCEDAVSTVKRWIMGVHLKLKCFRYQYGVKMTRSGTTTLDQFCNVNHISIEASETLEVLYMNSPYFTDVGYGLDNNTFDILLQPHPSTTSVGMTVHGQGNQFYVDIQDWFFAQKAVLIKDKTRNCRFVFQMGRSLIDYAQPSGEQNSFYYNDETTLNMLEGTHWSGLRMIDHFVPYATNTYDLGESGFRWKKIWAVNIDSTNAVVVSSDQRLKQQVRKLSAAEQAVAKSLKSLVRVYRLNAEVDEGAAPLHVGVMAQHVCVAFAKEGLDAHDYGVVSLDSNGMYGVRYEQLLAFIISTL